MRLLYILPEYLPHAGGGIITFYRMLLPHLVSMGHEVRVLIGSGAVAEDATPPVVIDGVHVEVLDVAILRKHLPGFERYSAMPGLRNHLAAAWAMWEQTGRGTGFDVVECADWGLPLLPWVLEPGPPVVVQLHGSCGQIDVHDPVAGEEAQGELLRMLEMAAIRRADCVQSYSDANAEFWRRHADRSVDCLRPGWQSMVAGLPSAARTKRGLVVGRVQRWKGPQIVCEALRQIGKDAPFIDWVGRDTVYGDRGTKTSTFLVRTYPDIWGSRLIHWPQLPPDETARRQSAASFVVVPSTWDMFNFTCVEAMGLGTPVICSTGAGASELIEDGVNGFVFESGDATGLADALTRCLTLSPSERQSIGNKGRETIRTELEPRAAAARRLSAYKALLHTTRKTAEPDDWLRRASSPHAALSDRLAFLDHMPLDPLARYVWRRSLSKVWK